MDDQSNRPCDGKGYPSKQDNLIFEQSIWLDDAQCLKIDHKAGHNGSSDNKADMVHKFHFYSPVPFLRSGGLVVLTPIIARKRASIFD